MKTRKQQLLVVVGPTATGKTAMALRLAKKINGELMSADSRQVYTYMDIGTGKSLPVNSKRKTLNTKIGNYYEIDGVKLFGYDLVTPAEQYSVAHYLEYAEKVLENIWQRGKLPILVGGTGLYVKSVLDGIETTKIPVNIKLRESLGYKNRAELFEQLASMDPVRAALLNYSDKNNPRRLVRSIEVANWKLANKLEIPAGVPVASDMANHAPSVYEKTSCNIIGLTAKREYLNKRIEEHVIQRVGEGIEKEIIDLLTMGINWDMQSMNTLGYKEWKNYFKGVRSKAEVIKQWVMDEKQYVKRQLTWFKKDKRIKWFDISEKTWVKAVEKDVEKWYKKIS